MDRRSIMSLLIGITLFLSTWHIMLQQQEQQQYYEASLPANNNNFITPSVIPSFSSSSTSSLMNESAAFIDSSVSFDNTDNVPKKNNDFSQLIDLKNFEFLMNTATTCKDLKTKQPLVVILIHSAPGNFNKRRTIRETWGGRDERSLLRFFIGNVNNTSLEDDISEENQVYGDIVQGNFEDAYRNLTYKHVMVLKWFVYFCPHAKYLLKTDDDVLINTPLLYDVLESPTTSPYTQLRQSRRIFCSMVEKVRVKRTFRSKWRVSFKEYPEKYYPPFCPGYVILFTGDIVPLLYQVAQQLPYFWIDDVHITGTTATKANVTVEYPRNAFLSHLKDIKTNSTFLFSEPNVDETEIRMTWKMIVESNQLRSNAIAVENENEIV